MKQEFELSPQVKFIFTKNEHGFQEVLEDLPNSRTFNVATYNISVSDSLLLGVIKKLPPSTQVKLITNIPSRWYGYRDERQRNDARTQIQSYLRALDPRHFAPFVETFFSYETHCKLVASDNVVYIGSGNFSDASGKKFECGVIVRGRDLVKKLVDMVFSEIVPLSDPLTASPLATAIIQIHALASRLSDLKSHLRDVFYTWTDEYAGRNFEYFEWLDVRASTDDLNAVADFIREVERAIGDLQDESTLSTIASSFDGQYCDKIREIIATGSTLHSFVTHDSQSFMESILGRRAFADEDDFNQAVDTAADDDLSVRDEMANAAEAEVEKIFATLDKVIDELHRIAKEIKGLPSNMTKIDNT